jgi:hypothetical protein
VNAILRADARLRKETPMDEHSMDASPLASRIGAGIVTMLVAAFALGAMFMFLAPLDAADAVSGHRDDGAEECDSSGPGDGDCDDEDDFADRLGEP